MSIYRLQVTPLLTIKEFKKGHKYNHISNSSYISQTENWKTHVEQMSSDQILTQRRQML
jgi:hypothetical protein